MQANHTSRVYYSISELPRILAESNSELQLYILTGKSSFNDSPGRSCLNEMIFLTGAPFFFYTPSGLLPSKLDYDEFIYNYRDSLSDNSKRPILIAIGGGRIIDASKIICFYLNKNYNIRVQIIAIPTTAGSGSEATSFAVCWSNGTKYSINHPYLKPTDVILDCNLLARMPSEQVAISGLDTICQSIESYLNMNNTHVSDSYSLASLESSFELLPLIVSSPRADLISQMQYNSYISGMAINITKTSLPHAYSYHLTSNYNIPHGHAVGLCMANYLNEFSKLITACSPLTKPFEEKFERIISILSCNAKDVKRAWIEYMYRVNLAPFINDLITLQDLNSLKEQFDPLRLQNSPFNDKNHNMPEIYCRKSE
ncbi:iron-containing alcohol dehydrogenase [Pantoea sp. S61]|uniref:iron-containing alcohol dehydrogenase n=1 Tax=Pantoea sp. S61 TaxID=2767442 RepID=UPI00190E2B02|nr:iron-containing alcohol dehydrogenase [Pantoea sp. S61]MBK0123586.1 iron-containing alcohol dehydrogenase [Pantoea sp. S61]